MGAISASGKQLLDQINGKDLFGYAMGRMTQPIRKAWNDADTLGGFVDNFYKASDQAKPGKLDFGINRKTGNNLSVNSERGKQLLASEDGRYVNKDGNVFDTKTNEMVAEKAKRYYDGGKVLKTAALLPIGYRFLSGGGIYRDKDGNVDWAGVPFF